MTARELYEYALIELNKLEAPSLLLEDYNYFINKAVQQYINLVYAKQEIDQQSIDDIRVLKSTTVQAPSTLTSIPSLVDIISGGLYNKTYYIDLPEDYLHLLSCVVEYTVQKSNFKCYNLGDKVYFPARRLNSDMYSQIINNAYLSPTYKRPYYYINNINTVPNVVTNPGMDNTILNSGLDPENIVFASTATHAQLATYYNALATYESNPTETNKNAYLAALEVVRAQNTSLVDSMDVEGDRLSNPSTVRLELRFGQDDSIFKPTKIYVDYVKSPMYIRLTQDQINSTLDYSQVLEFPDYVCFEIVNIFTRLIMENASDPRLQTNMPINNTIANPLTQQAQSNK